MKIALLLAADYAAVDASGKLNILGAFTTINAISFPVKHQLMHLVIKLQMEGGEPPKTKKMRVKLVNQDGQELYHIASDFTMPTGKHGQRLEFVAVLGFRDLEFPQPGTYEFRVQVDGEEEALVIELLKLDQPQE